jgi:hypothetical protein
MAPLPPTLTFAQLYGDRAKNALGDDEEEIEEALRVVYLEWRTTDGDPRVDLLEVDMLADFVQPIGALGIFFADDHSKNGCLKLLHGFERHVGAVEKQDIDRKVNFFSRRGGRWHRCIHCAIRSKSVGDDGTC